MKDRNDLQSERICEYSVSTNRKKLWVTELDLLACLEKACQELSIDYFLIYGSALGAIRHHGFIPWDDDIDIGMLRSDFEVFRKRGREFFPDYVDIQYGLSERGVDLLMRIRDGRTTGVIGSDRGRPGNKGAFIEIYVYDAVYPGSRGKRQLLMSRFLAALLCPAGSQPLKGGVEHMLRRIIGEQRLWKWYEKNCRRAENASTGLVNQVSLPKYARDAGTVIEPDELVPSTSVPYEYTTARVPGNYEKYLTRAFGDYMKLPPVEERGKIHDLIVYYDPNRSYREYENPDVLDRYFNGEAGLELL